MEIVTQWNLSVRKNQPKDNFQDVPSSHYPAYTKINFMLINEKCEKVGEIKGNLVWDHMRIELLWVEEGLVDKEYSTRLLGRLESFARKNGCRLININTPHYPTQTFYRKKGYELFGDELRQYFFQKRFD